MKKLLLTLIIICAGTIAYAQGHMFVNSEKVFKSVAAYNNAMSQLETLAEQYQKNIDAAYATIEELYNNYQAQKSYLSESNRKTREDNIISREREVTQYQEDVFGPEGEMMKKRIEMIKPIQDKVFETINKYAESNGYTLVIDITANPAILYYSPSLDKTDAIIQLVK